MLKLLRKKYIFLEILTWQMSWKRCWVHYGFLCKHFSKKRNEKAASEQGFGQNGQDPQCLFLAWVSNMPYKQQLPSLACQVTFAHSYHAANPAELRYVPMWSSILFICYFTEVSRVGPAYTMKAAITLCWAKCIISPVILWVITKIMWGTCSVIFPGA